MRPIKWLCGSPQSCLQNLAFPLLLLKIKLKLVWYEMLQLCHVSQKGSHLQAPMPLSQLSQERDQCHRHWHVISLGRYHREHAERRLSHWQRQLLFCCSQWDVSYNRRRQRQGRSPIRKACHVENYLEQSLCPALYTTETPTLPSLTPSTHKNEHLDLPLTPLIHIFTHSTFFNFYWLIDFRERERREREKQWFMVPLIYAFICSCMCPDQGSNPQSWCIGTML